MEEFLNLKDSTVSETAVIANKYKLVINNFYICIKIAIKFLTVKTRKDVS